MGCQWCSVPATLPTPQRERVAHFFLLQAGGLTGLSVRGSHGVVRVGWGCVPSEWEGAALKVRGDHQGPARMPSVNCRGTWGESRWSLQRLLPDRTDLTWSSCSHQTEHPLMAGPALTCWPGNTLPGHAGKSRRNSAFINGLGESEGELGLQTADHFLLFF